MRAATRRIRPCGPYRALRDTPPLRYFLATQVLFGLATGAVSSPFVIHASRHLGLGDKVPHVALPSLLAAIVDYDVWCNRQERAALGRKVAFVAWPCALLAPMLVLAWRYPLGRLAHGILARRIAGRGS